MKKSERKVLHAVVAVRSAGGSARVREVTAAEAGIPDDVVQMFTRIHRSKDFTVENSRKDYDHLLHRG